MSARPGVVVDVRVPADGGTSPNRFDPAVSAHVRVYWPPLATGEQVSDALEQAAREARTSVEAKRGERLPLPRLAPPCHPDARLRAVQEWEGPAYVQTQTVVGFECWECGSEWAVDGAPSTDWRS